MKPEAALERAGRALLLGVRGDQRRVDVDHDPLGRRARRPSAFARARARAARNASSSPGSRGDRGRSPETPSRPTRPARTAAPDRAPRAGPTDSRRRRRASPPDRGSPGPDRAGRAARARPPARPTAPRSARPGRPPRPATPRRRATPDPSPSAATSTVKRRPSRCTFKVNLPSSVLRLRQPAESLLRRTVQRPRPPGPQLLHARSGLAPRKQEAAVLGQAEQGLAVISARRSDHTIQPTLPGPTKT